MNYTFIPVINIIIDLKDSFNVINEWAFVVYKEHVSHNTKECLKILPIQNTPPQTGQHQTVVLQNYSSVFSISTPPFSPAPPIYPWNKRQRRLTVTLPLSVKAFPLSNLSPFLLPSHHCPGDWSCHHDMKIWTKKIYHNNWRAYQNLHQQAIHYQSSVSSL